MRQTEQDIKNELHQNLNKTSYEGTFSNIWTLHLNKGGSNRMYKKAAFVPVVIIITLLTLFTVGYASLTRITDDINLPFVDDPEIIGNWETVDFVNEISDFDPDSKSFKGELYLNNLVFIKSGRMLDRLENSNLYSSLSTWTNGVIISTHEQTASKYKIKEINGSKYMFFEWKNGDYIFRFMKPKYYVLKQIDAKDYSDFEVTRIEDKIDYEFLNNPEMLGRWESVDFVKEIDDFELGKRLFEGELYLKELNIQEDGKLSIKFKDDTTSTTVSSWTEDLIIDHKEKTASKCNIMEINDRTYMFFEWKSDDYVFRGMKPSYYVFKKVE